MQNVNRHAIGTNRTQPRKEMHNRISKKKST